METREYKGQRVSLLGFGCMRLPLKSASTSDIDYETGQQMVDYAIAHGVNYFDTAYPYHNGNSELFIGEALSKYPRGSFNLASKMPIWAVDSPESVHKLFEEQLAKCRVDYFDFYLLHNISAHSLLTVEKFGIYEILKEKQAAGQIRNFGFSFHDQPAVLESFVKKHPFDFAQIQLNYVDWELQNAQAQYEILQANGLPVIVMEPVRGGALAQLCPQAADIFNAADPSASTASWAIRFAASLPGVMTVLSGMTNLDQVIDNVKTMSPFRPLTSPDRAVIEQALAAYRLSSPIPCTACRYCMDCPSGVDIPRVFGLYNQYRATGNDFSFQSQYGILGKDHQGRNCVSCGSCTPQCPQSIDIPARLAEVEAAYVEAKKNS